MQFEVGQKVVCIDDRPGAITLKDHPLLVKGEVYTVHALVPDLYDHTLKLPNQVLVEIEERPNKQFLSGYAKYGAWRFRPVQEFKSKWVEQLVQTLKEGKPIRIKEDV